MNKLLLLILFEMSCVLLLVGCGPVYQTSYSYQPPASLEARRCIVQCQQNQIQCNAVCMNQNNQCEMLAQQSALFQYNAYINQQRLAGQPITEGLQDFYDDTSCQMQPLCNCTSQYNQCYQLCDGQVITKQKCVAFCGNR